MANTQYIRRTGVCTDNLGRFLRQVLTIRVETGSCKIFWLQNWTVEALESWVVFLVWLFLLSCWRHFFLNVLCLSLPWSTLTVKLQPF